MDTNTVPNQLTIDETPDIAHIQKVTEAVLFAAGHPVTYAKLADVIGVTPSLIRRAVADYAEQYNKADSALPRGIMLLTFDDSCQLCTMEQYNQAIREALGIRRGGNLSASSILFCYTVLFQKLPVIPE